MGLRSTETQANWSVSKLDAPYFAHSALLSIPVQERQRRTETGAGAHL